jgi:hypothetical protein
MQYQHDEEWRKHCLFPKLPRPEKITAKELADRDEARRVLGLHGLDPMQHIVDAISIVAPTTDADLDDTESTIVPQQTPRSKSKLKMRRNIYFTTMN